MAVEKDASNQRTLSLPGLPYVQDLIGAYADIVQEQSTRLTGILERMGGGDYSTDQLVADTAWVWTEWIRDVMQIGTTFQRSMVGDALPTVVFVLDATAEGADPKETPIAIRIDRAVKIAATPLTRIPTGGEIGAEKVKASLTGRHDHLRVAIVDISKLPAGHYLGWVYVDAKGSKKPLAAVHLVKLEARPGADTKSTTTKKAKKTA